MQFDLNMLRSVVTLASFIAFLGIVWWAYSRRNRERFDEAAQLPFESD
ncbi:MAG: cbb3-type cytochrome c oxidase subunit 3 [Betaproteobacteria bacterium]|nr:cbb3-type cytochrome c oxidase subunit 3 [Betaproteobacteria bacterium]MDE2047441.1 cbb3-type cytochrome c oxidase subunit 3 [Betaproteobacteria bacterium]